MRSFLVYTFTQINQGDKSRRLKGAGHIPRIVEVIPKFKQISL